MQRLYALRRIHQIWVQGTSFSLQACQLSQISRESHVSVQSPGLTGRLMGKKHSWPLWTNSEPFYAYYNIVIYKVVQSVFL